MARRKRLLDDGDDSDSVSSDADLDLENDPDAREERELFENPYRKRRRTNGKESATYGIFADDNESEAFGRQANSSTKRSDWTKAPAFVSGDKPVKLDESMQVDSASASEADQDECLDLDGDDDDDNGSGVSEGEDEESVEAEYSGIGSKTSHPSFIDSVPGTSSRDSPVPASIPSAFSSRSQSFMRDAQPSVKPVSLPASEMAHFRTIQNSFGAKMLAKMGWTAGSGLGVSGEGIAVPVESKLRPQKMGIAFKGFQEKTKQSKMEARRRGETISDDEDEKTRSMKKRVKEAEKKRSEAWRRPKKAKTKIEHKTYDEILAEAGEEATVAGIGQIIDARGPVVRV